MHTHQDRYLAHRPPVVGLVEQSDALAGGSVPYALLCTCVCMYVIVIERYVIVSVIAMFIIWVGTENLRIHG